MELSFVNRVPEGRLSFNWFEDGILFGQFAPQLVIDLDTARETINARKKFAGSGVYPFLVEVSDVKSVTKEARDYFASADGTSNVIAAAIMTNSVLGKMMCNFFLNCSKPLVPTKLFTSREEAIKWLGKFKNKQLSVEQNDLAEKIA